MTHNLTASVRAGDVAAVRVLLSEGTNLDVRDEHGWTALSWAAGAGNVQILQILLNAGADPCLTGNDDRTPFQIAEAAGHTAAAALIHEAASALGRAAAATGGTMPLEMQYCRAYALADLRRFPGWTDKDTEMADDAVVFLHRDLTVTAAIWPGEKVLWVDSSEAWQGYCIDQLSFRVNEDA